MAKVCGLPGFQLGLHSQMPKGTCSGLWSCQFSRRLRKRSYDISRRTTNVTIGDTHPKVTIEFLARQAGLSNCRCVTSELRLRVLHIGSQGAPIA